MKNYIVIPLISKPGIQRDGTPFASESYINGQWCRFYMQRPRKIGGYKLIDEGNAEIIRALFAVPMPNAIDLYLGRASSLRYITLDLNGNGEGEIDRTPGGYVSNVNNIWGIDLFTNANVVHVASSFIVGLVAPNGTDISNTTNGNLYYGDSNLDTPLIKVVDVANSPVTASGGCIFAAPVMVIYGNDGFVRWSAPNMLFGANSWPDANNLVVSNTKIIQALLYRGSVIMWTVSSILSLTYDPVNQDFIPSTIQSNISIMSPNSVVEYNQQLFWIGTDQFYFFNGIVNRLENSMSSDWFFQNVNLSQRSKIWGMVVSRYNEIWWHYPRGTNTECSDVIIYNVELQVWYDSVNARGAGLSVGLFPLPLMSDTQLTAIATRAGFTNNYGLWMHEYGWDQVIGPNTYAIESYFETHIITLFGSKPDENRLIRSRRVEPDLAQVGNMTVTVNNRMFPSDSLANGQLLQSGPYTFTADTQKVDDVNSQGRLVSFVFNSNVVGGIYQAGQTLLDYEVGDVNP